MPRFTPEFLDELKARVRPSDVVGRYVKLRRQGNEYAGLSPFTKEKTPSFFVNDQKGFFHCFSSGKHGDVIAFLTETQKMSFHEAVEMLAGEAGMELPKETPGEAARAEAAKGLAEVCEAAAKFYAAMLRRADGRACLDYLYARDVSDAQIEAFRIGYAPGARTAFKDWAINKGFTEDMLVEAGMLIKPEGGGASYDRFRNRVMFPIAGARERVIAFGGRALDKDARAKYLNSPETPLFHKGGQLYNLGPARAASAADKKPLIVCEGYMDVIALWGAGVKRAVAPLGTALTEGQLALLWRASDEPVLCFDGDRAGTGAAYRAIDRALPLLKPGKSLTFAFMPEGEDPDDLVRAQGAGAFHKILEAADPLVDVLWRREREAKPLDTPERRAAFRTHLRDLVKAIGDKDVRNAYGAEFANRLNNEFAPPAKGGPGRGSGTGASGWSGGSGPGRGRWGPRPLEETARASADLKNKLNKTDASWTRQAALVAALLVHPALVERQEDALVRLELENIELSGLLADILSAVAADPGLDRAALNAQISAVGSGNIVERIESDRGLLKQKFLSPTAEIDEVEWGFKNALAHHLFESSLKPEVARSASQIFENGEEIWKAAMAAREELINSSKSDSGPVDDGDGPGLEDVLEKMKTSVEHKRGR